MTGRPQNKVARVHHAADKLPFTGYTIAGNGGTPKEAKRRTSTRYVHEKRYGFLLRYLCNELGICIFTTSVEAFCLAVIVSRTTSFTHRLPPVGF
jgi:hypothetical protein